MKIKYLIIILLFPLLGCSFKYEKINNELEKTISELQIELMNVKEQLKKSLETEEKLRKLNEDQKNQIAELSKLRDIIDISGIYRGLQGFSSNNGFYILDVEGGFLLQEVKFNGNIIENYRDQYIFIPEYLSNRFYVNLKYGNSIKTYLLSPNIKNEKEIAFFGFYFYNGDKGEYENKVTDCFLVKEDIDKFIISEDLIVNNIK